jgi:hypothetical protein
MSLAELTASTAPLSIYSRNVSVSGIHRVNLQETHRSGLCIIHLEEYLSASIDVDTQFPLELYLCSGHLGYTFISYLDYLCYLTDNQLRQLHRRFGHPSAPKLSNLLRRAGHDINSKTAQHLTKYCQYCQKYGKSPGRFKFSLQDDDGLFNHCIVVDILYIDGSPVLHIVDEATSFQAAKWLKDTSTGHTWNVLRQIWIDTYLGPPDVIKADAGRNFTSKEFKQHATSMQVTIDIVTVEAHWSIGQVERYHQPLRRAYEIIKSEATDTTKDMALLALMD